MTRTSLEGEWIDIVIGVEELNIMDLITRRGWLAGAAVGLAGTNMVNAADGAETILWPPIKRKDTWSMTVMAVVQIYAVQF